MIKTIDAKSTSLSACEETETKRLYSNEAYNTSVSLQLKIEGRVKGKLHIYYIV